MNYITVGTLGHVDHGKTALVRALTGVDTDRLKEEKERGLSIALGYANLELPHGEVGFVDAPGHEKFIRTMVAGATAIEAVLLIVDVNEGVKPQTQEHLDIAGLLGIKRGVIVVTKCDAAAPGRLDAIEEELQILTLDTFLEDAPVVYTSAKTGAGLEALTDRLDEWVSTAAPLPDEGCAYLPVDRVFTMAGFGTVVTGTLRRGALHVGTDVALEPHGLKAQVRELQVHNRPVDEARPGFRTAVNLRGIDRNQVQRGDVLATRGSVRPGRVLDVELHVPKNAAWAVQHRQLVRVLFGTKETFARVHLLGRDEVPAGESALLQLKLEETVAPLNLEPFIIRSYSPMTTIGGGRIVDVAEHGYKRKDPGAVEHIAALAKGDSAAALLETVASHGRGGITLPEAARARRLQPDEARAVARTLPVVFLDEQRVVHETVFEQECDRILTALARYQKSRPTESGMPHTQLHDGANPKLVEGVLERLARRKRVELDGGMVRLAGFTPAGALTDDQRALAREIETAVKSAGLRTSSASAVIGSRKDGETVLKFLINQGVLIPIHVDARSRNYTNALIFHRDVLNEAKARIQEAFSEEASVSVPEIKDLLGISRKYAIPLLEYFDKIGVTKRNGDHRTVIGPI